MIAVPKPARILRLFWFRLRHRPARPHLVTTSARGLRFQVDSGSVLAEGIYSDSFERHERAILDSLLREGDVALDVGANIGFYTCHFARKVGATGRVLAFEPTPDAYQRLLKNVEMNSLGDIVEARQVALSNKKGHLDFHLFEKGNDAYNSPGVTHSFSETTASRTLQVECDVLDSIFEQYLARRTARTGSFFVKIDVEGFEEAVIKGGTQYLRSIEDVSLMVELCQFLSAQCGSTVRGTLELMRSLGYEPYWVLSNSLHPLRETDLANLETYSANVFFLKPHGIKRLQERGKISQ